MADKMMRIAGRGDDGLSKALKTDNNGRIETQTNTTRKIYTNNTVLKPNEKIRSPRMYTNGYTKGRSIIRIANNRQIKVYVIDVENNVVLAPIVVFEGMADRAAVSEYTLTSDSYFIEVENIGTIDVQINETSFETLYNAPVKQEVVMTNRKGLKEIILPFTSVDPASIKTVTLLPDNDTDIWKVKYITAEMEGVSKGSGLSLEWNLHSQDNINSFMHVKSVNGKITISPAGITDGLIILPNQFSDDKMIQFFDFIKDFAYVTRERPSYFRVNNNTTEGTLKIRVKIYVMEEK